MQYSLCLTDIKDILVGRTECYSFRLPSSQKTHHGLRRLGCVYTMTPSHSSCASQANLRTACSSISSVAPSLPQSRDESFRVRRVYLIEGVRHLEPAELKRRSSPCLLFLQRPINPFIFFSFHQTLLSSHSPLSRSVQFIEQAHLNDKKNNNS